MNILLVDDHPMTTAGYKYAILESGLIEPQPIFFVAHNCDDAADLIARGVQNQNPFDLAILDQGLPGNIDKGIVSGSDLTLLIKKQMPNCKVIMITAHTEIVIVFDISKKIRPHGLVIKNDLSPENLPEIITEVLQGNTYNSPTAKYCIKEIWKKDLMVDDINRQILMCLSNGFKAKEIEEFVNLSISTIQKRIVKMNNAFDVKDDNGLVKEATRQGYI